MGTYQCVCNEGYQQTGLKSHCEGKVLGTSLSTRTRHSTNFYRHRRMRRRALRRHLHQHPRQLLLFLRVGSPPCVPPAEPSHSRSGYSLLLDGKTCADIDECKENPRICNGGKCTNTIGSYICHCTEGLLPGPGGTSCLGKSQRCATVDLNDRFRHRRVQAKSKHLRQRRMRQHSGVVPVQVRRRLLCQARRGPFLQRRRRVLLGVVQLPHQRRLHK